MLQKEENMIYPQKNWQKKDPEKVGVNLLKLRKAMNKLDSFFLHNDDEAGASQSVVIKNGYLIWQGDETDAFHPVWSCTKSYISTVLGLLIDENLCSLDTLIYEYVPEIGEEYKGVTLRHLTTMTSGYNAIGYTYDQDGSENPFVPDTPLFAPGTKYLYWDDPMNLFALVLTRISGRSLEEVFTQKIATPLQIQNFKWGQWEHYPEQNNTILNGGSGNLDKGVSTTPLDLARFGLLFLSKGKWDGKQLISEKWVEQATTTQVSNELPNIVYAGRTHLTGSGHYGYNWWTNGVNPNSKKRIIEHAPEGLFYASGLCDNKCFVIPEWEMVVVRMGTCNKRIEMSQYSEFFKLLGDAID